MTSGSGLRSSSLLAVVAGLAALLVYWITLAPSLGFIDSGELSAAAYGFGIAHPTGYPLFVWLAGIWARVPIASSVILRLNLFSALATAAAVAVCVDVMWRLLGRAGFAGSASRAAAALAAASFLAFNRTVWSNALTIEVYPLHLALLSVVLALTVRALDERESARAERAWRWLALAVGLAFSNHLTMIQLVPGLLLALVVAARRGSLRVRVLPSLALCFVAGLAPYLSLPLRAAQDPAANWGDPRTLDAFLAHVTAQAYRGRFFLGLQPFLEALREFVAGLPSQSGVVTASLAILGAARLAVRDPVLAGVLGGWLLTSVGVAASYAIPDIASYFLLAYYVLALLAGYAVAQLAAWFPTRERAAAAGLAALAAVTLLFANRDVSERGNFLVVDFADNMFHSLQRNALVISYQWDHWLSPALYLQRVEQVRPDVLVLDKSLCQRAWYLRQLLRRHPDACAGALREADALLGALGRGAQPSPDVPPLVDAFLQAIVDRNADVRPVYVTMDVEPQFPSGYRQLPEGLALRLYRPDRLPPVDAPVWDDFQYRPFPRRDGWTDRLRQYYAVMLMARGAYNEDAGRPLPALRYYERALAFEPSPSVSAQLGARLLRARAAARQP